MAPHAQYLRGGIKMGPVDFVDTMIKDGLWDAFNGYHMGNTAENVARQFQITRAQQDEFAVASQNKAEAAPKGRQVQGRNRPRSPSRPARATSSSATMNIRAMAPRSKAMAKLKPAFEKDGTVTAGRRVRHQ